MRPFVKFLLIFSLLVPSVPINSFAQKLPEDCAICGHACCCPEMCKPLIEKMKKKAASHCEQAISICSLQSAPPIGILNLQSESVYANPRLTVLGDANPIAGISKERIQETVLRFEFSTSRDIPTPPPKISA